jgi:SAM-dependent MidA family methyltransferase
MANANLTLPDLLRSRLREAPQGRLTWAEVMRMALYEPGLGYYRRGVRRIGRSGDFFTSVSVGPLFGKLLAEYVHQQWCERGRPARFTVIEQGAHDGTLARDVLEGCGEIAAEFFAGVRYLILEPDATLREAQRATLGEELGAKLSHDVEDGGGAAVFLCNELLDAFPVNRVRWDGRTWKELWVCQDNDAQGGLAFVEGEISAADAAAEIEGRGAGLPEGWTTEVCPAVANWLDEISRIPFSGSILILDYGFTAEEHFATDRTEGTLRRYANHRMDDRVLEELGEADLTAHVDFTRVTELAEARGLRRGQFKEQGRFLTQLFVRAFERHGKAPASAMQRQFHTLTHPGQMGRTFHALELIKANP